MFACIAQMTTKTDDGYDADSNDDDDDDGMSERTWLQQIVHQRTASHAKTPRI